MGYVIYGRPGSGSMVVEAALAELGFPHEVRVVERQEDGSLDPALLALNPRGQVPVLVLPDGSAMTETAAMLLHLADAHPGSGLAPLPGSSARAQHDRWLCFFHANVYEAMLRYFYSDRYVIDPAAAETVKAAALSYILQHFALFEAQLGAGPYYNGDNLAMLDLYVWMLAQWVDPALAGVECPKLARLCQAVAVRPAVARVQARNG